MKHSPLRLSRTSRAILMSLTSSKHVSANESQKLILNPTCELGFRFILFIAGTSLRLKLFSTAVIRWKMALTYSNETQHDSNTVVILYTVKLLVFVGYFILRIWNFCDYLILKIWKSQDNFVTIWFCELENLQDNFVTILFWNQNDNFMTI